ncbi:MAG: hypothetical protein O7B99_12860 [Planctomycetota bacterium]|nr:hypothetical protein [Planctomycetota bacterium]
MRSQPSLGLVLLVLACGACAAPRDMPLEHVLTFDREGDPVAPATGIFRHFDPFDEMGRRDYRAHVELMLQALLDGAPRAKDGRRRVLIFIHGGMRRMVYSARRSTELKDPILADGYWPIFINWESSLSSSYRDHLFFVRQGDDWGWWGVPLFPVYLIQDLAWGLGRVPVTLVSQTTSFIQGLPGILVGEQRTAGRVVDRMGGADPGLFERMDESSDLELQEEGELVPIDIWIGDDLQTGPDTAADFLSRTLTAPLKLIENPFLSGLGPSAWNIMERRIYLLLHSEREFRSGLTRPGRRGLARFIAQLRELQVEEGLEITLIAHSMGAIVANEILREDPELEIDNIVFMAAACSLRDYETTIFPYMEAHPRTEVYHLTLHPKGEVRERQFLDLTPRGSLLVWIDGFLTQPLTPSDRVAGIFSNLVLAVHRTPDELRPRIHIKAFPTGRGVDPLVPTRHLHFTERRFWDPAFWKRP